MFREYIFCLVLAAATFNANADCSVTFHSGDQVRKVIKKSDGWTFNNYDQICTKLNKARAALRIQGNATVLSNHSIAWAVVGVKDVGLEIASQDFSGTSTQINTFASIDKAEEMLWIAINDAVSVMDLDNALQQLEIARKQVRAAYKK
jgi:hypothetical protein